MLELTIRLVVSLAIVVGLMLLLARLGARRFSGSSKSMVHVLHRQPLSKASSLAVVSVGGRVLVLGATEHQVSLLTELDPEDLGEDLTDLVTLDPGAHEEPAVTTPGTITELDTPATSAARTGVLAVVPPVRRTVGRHVRETAPQPPATGPLAGSLLSPQTWRDALAAATKGA